MIITNNHNLPQAFVELASQEYEVAPNEYRVTSLLRGVRETILLRRHNDEITVDVADMVWLLFGTAVHNILEHQQEADSELKEERLKVAIEIDGVKCILSGKPDLYCYDKKKVTDYKTGSVWKVIYQDYADFREQLLMYGWMLKTYGFPVGMGEIVLFLKDHSKEEAKRKADYPQLPVQTIKFSFSKKDFAEVEERIRHKLTEIKAAENLPDDELPVCTPEERFNDGDKFAVMKKGNKKALRLLDSEEEADAWIAKNGKGDYIECRPGRDKKCESYCWASEFCNYWQEQKRVAEQGQPTERSA